KYVPLQSSYVIKEVTEISAHNGGSDLNHSGFLILKTSCKPSIFPYFVRTSSALCTKEQVPGVFR
ncbi:hypothetical protein, partial [Candidatus Hakubella thermalkaliphila]|uniref:hypothetical protein n=1 Tax=Candidatus Hakubella thermalkaliphila TaxID=2754717 RepID=UPI001C6114ED